MIEKGQLDKLFPWRVISNRFVGYIDIMGFKEMVLRTNHEDLYHHMKGLSKQIKMLSENLSLTKYFMFSDSILVFSQSDEPPSVSGFLYVMQIFMEYLYKTATPFKGAIAYGKNTVDDSNSIFFGQPLIDAYLLAEELLFYGIAYHHSGEKKLLELGDKKSHDEIKVPFKSGIVKQRVLNTSPYFLKEISPEEICKKYRNLTSGGLRKYIDNTEDMLNAILQVSRRRQY